MRSSLSIRFVLVWTALLAASLLATSSSPLAAQVRIPTGALQDGQSDLDSVLRQGSQMEGEGRWGEALGLYERAWRQFPNHEGLRRTLSVARLHFDVRRRHADHSFVAMVRDADMTRAIQAYQEVLQKIQTFHVDEPDWAALWDRGSQATLISMGSESFQQAFGRRFQAAEIEDARRVLDQVVANRPIRDRYELQQAVGQAAQALEQRCGVRGEVFVFEYLCGATSALDWYSSFLTTAQYDEVMSQIDGNFVGLGVELKPMVDHLHIVDVIPNGPAGQGGLLVDERILEVDGFSVRQLGGNEAADRLRGPEGSTIDLAVQARDGAVRRLRLQRRRVEIPSVSASEMLDAEQGVAYMKLSSFQRSTRDEVSRSLWDLHRRGMQSLVIDLRGNPGGLLDAAVDVADLFLTSGTIVTTRGRNLDENSVHRARFDGTWRVPVVVLIDEDSASASEILAGALHDNRRATVVGQRSYGKGSVQGIFALHSCSAGIRLTTAKFYLPSGTAISQAGIEPDVPVSPLAATADTSRASDPAVALRPRISADPSLDAAVRIATRKIQPLGQ